MSMYGATSPDTPKYDDAARTYDAVLVMSFGGPEGIDEVMPFLENVTRGRNIPRPRLEQVAEHYYAFGGVSPINAQNRALIEALRADLDANGLGHLPVYFGNRNWHPLIEDTVRQMRDDGVKRAIAFFTSGFSCYSGCRQYREDIIRACEAVDGAPEFDKIRVFYNHPGFIAPMIEKTRAALDGLPQDLRAGARLVFTAHSIPMGMAKGSAYERQLSESARLIAEGVGVAEHVLVYQSRSGAPHQPWLEPDVCDYLRQVRADGALAAVIVPVGFISDHMEVLYDLDHEAHDVAAEIGLALVRAETVGTHPRFVQMIRELIVERMTAAPVRLAVGQYAANHDVCPVGCCQKG